MFSVVRWPSGRNFSCGITALWFRLQRPIHINYFKEKSEIGFFSWWNFKRLDQSSASSMIILNSIRNHNALKSATQNFSHAQQYEIPFEVQASTTWAASLHHVHFKEEVSSTFFLTDLKKAMVLSITELLSYLESNFRCRSYEVERETRRCESNISS